MIHSITIISLYSLLVLANSQKILTQSTEYHILTHNTIELHCNLIDISDDHTVIWKRGKDTLFVDEDQLTYDERYYVLREGMNSTLVIKSVEPIDNTLFYCELTDPLQIVHYRLIVHNPPTVRIIPEQSEYVAHAGDTNLIIRCYALGNPKPITKWSYSSGNVTDDVLIKDHQLIIPVVQQHHSGDYTCNATNKAGNAIQRIRIKVYVKPFIKADSTFLPVNVGGNYEILCTYDGYPKPTTDWLFNGQRINFAAEPFNTVARQARHQNNTHITSLLFTNMTEEHFGDYICRVSNTLGSDKAVVHASARPGPPTIVCHDKVIFWTIISKNPIIEYKLFIRYADDEEWIRFENILAKKSDEIKTDIWEREIKLQDYFEPDIKYEVQVQGRNSFGWGSLAKNYATPFYALPKKERISASSTVMNALVMLWVFLVFNQI